MRPRVRITSTGEAYSSLSTSERSTSPGVPMRNRPAGQVEHPVDVLEHRVHVMGHEQHAEAALAAMPVDQVADDPLRAQVERAQRLVAEQEARVARERLPDPQSLLLAAGQAGHRHARVVRGADGVEQGVDAPAAGGGRERDPPAVTVDAERDQVAAAEGDPVIRSPLLRDVADAPVSVTDRVAEQGRRARASAGAARAPP